MSGGLLKDWWSICIFFIVNSIHGRPQASIAVVFRQSAVYVISCSGVFCYVFLIRLTPFLRLFFTISGLIFDYLAVSDEFERND